MVSVGIVSVRVLVFEYKRLALKRYSIVPLLNCYCWSVSTRVIALDYSYSSATIRVLLLDCYDLSANIRVLLLDCWQ